MDLNRISDECLVSSTDNFSGDMQGAHFITDVKNGFVTLTIFPSDGGKIDLRLPTNAAGRLMFNLNGLIKKACLQQLNIAQGATNNEVV